MNFPGGATGVSLPCRGHHQLFDHRHGQRALVENQVVILQHVEILAGGGLIFLAQVEPFAKADDNRWAAAWS